MELQSRHELNQNEGCALGWVNAHMKLMLIRGQPDPKKNGLTKFDLEVCLLFALEMHQFCLFFSRYTSSF